ncbi:AN1-type zinc finger protein 1-like [Diorhabda carinulata]|uniref:AN1-type zinc finger protein 1-like n=1 Tax=Diorhabda carinulata TaxID=1163345 RepID=UPI0025A0DD85|nr:AN1-type zinc finger protein 1-like [Diorhabda carinulata]
MEFPNIGKQCAHSQCKQLDYLPLVCKCGEIFCSEHYNGHIQHCEVANPIIEAKSNNQVESVFICSHLDCKKRDIVPLICGRCQKHYCVEHRHLAVCNDKDEETLRTEKEKFSAPMRAFNEAKAIVDKQLDKNLYELKKNPKNRDIAKKVLLMKIKNKATGLTTVPMLNRVYFNVTYAENSLPIFVSNQWSLGRAIDAIAQEMKLRNDNNKATDTKLRLFKEQGNASISSDLSITIKELIDHHVLFDGDSLLIKYVKIS